MYAARRRQRSVQWKFQFGKLRIRQPFQLFDDLFGQFPQGSLIGHQVALHEPQFVDKPHPGAGVVYMARKNMGSMIAIMPRVAPELPAVSRKTKNSGTPTTAAAPKQISCRAVRLKATLDFTLLKSRGTEI